MDVNTQNERSKDKRVCYYASTSFKKKLLLPPQPKWKVREEEMVLEGFITLNTRVEGMLFDTHCSSTKPRYVCLTVNGFLAVYMKDNSGHILNLNTSESIKSGTIVSKDATKRYCDVKIKFSYGTITLYLEGEDVAIWRNALDAACDGSFKNIFASRIEQMTRAVSVFHSVPSEIDIPNVVDLTDDIPSGPYELIEVATEDTQTDPSDSEIRLSRISSEDSLFSSQATIIGFVRTEETKHTKVPNSPPPSPVSANEMNSSEDSTNSGFFTDYTYSEENCTTVASFSVPELREILEGTINNTIENKLKIMQEVAKTNKNNMTLKYDTHGRIIAEEHEVVDIQQIIDEYDDSAADVCSDGDAD